MSGTYICIFIFIFLGITGAVSVVFSAAAFFAPREKHAVVIKNACCDDVEYRVRHALRTCGGDVFIAVSRSADDEFAEICRRLCRDNDRVKTVMLT